MFPPTFPAFHILKYEFLDYKFDINYLIDNAKAVRELLPSYTSNHDFLVKPIKYDYASVHLDLRHQSIPGLVNDNSFANDPQCSWLKLKNQDLGLEQCPNNICPHNVWILEQVYD